MEEGAGVIGQPAIVRLQLECKNGVVVWRNGGEGEADDGDGDGDIPKGSGRESDYVLPKVIVFAGALASRDIFCPR